VCIFQCLVFVIWCLACSIWYSVFFRIIFGIHHFIFGIVSHLQGTRARCLFQIVLYGRDLANPRKKNQDTRARLSQREGRLHYNVLSLHRYLRLDQRPAAGIRSDLYRGSVNGCEFVPAAVPGLDDLPNSRSAIKVADCLCARLAATIPQDRNGTTQLLEENASDREPPDPHENGVTHREAGGREVLAEKICLRDRASDSHRDAIVFS
jgi:hypothetical protein